MSWGGASTRLIPVDANREAVIFLSSCATDEEIKNEAAKHVKKTPLERISKNRFLEVEEVPVVDPYESSWEKGRSLRLSR